MNEDFSKSQIISIIGQIHNKQCFIRIPNKEIARMEYPEEKYEAIFNPYLEEPKISLLFLKVLQYLKVG